MKINDQNPQPRPADLGVSGARTEHAHGAHDRRGHGAQGGTSSVSREAGPAADVTLSSRGRELHGALSKVQSAPDVRADKVAEVRSRLERGTYVIDPTRIAKGILDANG